MMQQDQKLFSLLNPGRFLDLRQGVSNPWDVFELPPHAACELLCSINLEDVPFFQFDAATETALFGALRRCAYQN
jgi:hypothetical protein